jgi:hypothetical protein
MKKIFTFCAILISGLGFSQGSLRLNYGGTSILMDDTIINLNTVTPGQNLTNNVNYTNTSGSTKSYKVRKNIYVQNPAAGTSITFCIGGICYPATTFTSPSSVTLTAGQSSGTLTVFTADYTEGASIGYSYVKFTFYDIANPNDSTRISFKYNQALGIKTMSDILSSVSEIFPNPTNENASVAVTLKQDADVKVQVYNSLGSLVYNAPAQKYAPGKRNISINCSDLSSGLYFVAVLAGENKITKRMVVNK